MKKNTLTAVIMATMLEAKPFVSGLSLDQVHKKPFLVFTNKKYILLISGIGKANAAMASAYCCTKFKPDIIFNTGAAGALTMSKSKGEIYQISKIIEHDRPDFKTSQPFIHNLSILKGVKVETAILSTSDKAAVSRDEREKVSKYGGELVDMEGASIVQACKKFRTPCHMFKYVSDTLEDTENSNIIDNIRSYRQKSFLFFKEQILKSQFR